MQPVDVKALLEESRANEGQTCHTCLWLRTRPDKEREAWEEAIGDRSYPNTQIVRAIRKADGGKTPGPSSVANHRNGHTRNLKQGGNRV